ncbi:MULTISPECIES: hypothetical protein [Mycobacteroides]|jgi:high-affinity Fe2+/Pb2+ permease|nr:MULTISPECIES: hypothetical protein [Mycobacteroides]SKN57321.1 Uncharacterised protein [Mycobacteroides abscessus subsp. massiliense]
MIGTSNYPKALAIVGGVAIGALLGVALGVALFVYESKHDMEANY